MSLLALLLYAVFGVAAVGVRVFVQWRRTGDSGLRLDAGPVGGSRWWAKVGLISAIVLCAAAPLAAMAGLRPVDLLVASGWRWAGLVVATAGIAGTSAAQLAMGDSWRIGVDPAERTPLKTGGPFAYVRNPIYTALLVGCAGLGLMTGNIVAVLGFAALVAAIEAQVRLVEEPYLRQVHGESFRRYAARVGRFLPGIGRGFS